MKCIHFFILLCVELILAKLSPLKWPNSANVEYSNQYLCKGEDYDAKIEKISPCWNMNKNWPAKDTNGFASNEPKFIDEYSPAKVRHLVHHDIAYEPMGIRFSSLKKYNTVFHSPYEKIYVPEQDNWFSPITSVKTITNPSSLQVIANPNPLNGEYNVLNIKPYAVPVTIPLELTENAVNPILKGISRKVLLKPQEEDLATPEWIRKFLNTKPNMIPWKPTILKDSTDNNKFDEFLLTAIKNEKQRVPVYLQFNNLYKTKFPSPFPSPNVRDKSELKVYATPHLNSKDDDYTILDPKDDFKINRLLYSPFVTNSPMPFVLPENPIGKYSTQKYYINTYRKSSALDNWLGLQIQKIILNRCWITKHIDINYFKHIIMNTLKGEGVHITYNNELVDSSGNIVNLSHLKLHPTVINYDREDDNQNKVDYKLDAEKPHLEGFSIALGNPPKIIGVVPVGTVHIPSEICKKSINKPLIETKDLYFSSLLSKPRGPQNTERSGFTELSDSKFQDHYDSGENENLIKPSVKRLQLSSGPEVEDYENSQDLDETMNKTDADFEEEDIPPGFRIIGGSAATSSGTPVSSRGRSGDYSNY